MASRLHTLLGELKRRKVLRAAVWYAGAGLAFAQGAEYFFEIFGLPLSAARFVLLLVAAGFPIALVVSWFVDITRAGIRQTSAPTSEELAAFSPRRWSRSGWILVGAGTLVVLAVGFVMYARLTSPLPPDRVAVFPFKNLTGNQARDDWGLTTARLITDVLSGARELRPESPESLRRSLSDPENEDEQEILAAAREMGLGKVVTGEFLASGQDSVVFTARILRVRGGKTLQTIREAGAAVAFEAVIHSVAGRVTGALAASLDPGTAYLLRHPFHYEAYQSFYRAEEAFYAYRWGDAIGSYWEAYQRDTTLLTALIGVGVAARNAGARPAADTSVALLKPRLQELDPKERFWYDWMTAEDRSARLNVIRTEMKRDPDDPTRILLGMEALDLGYVWEAVGVLEEVDAEDPLVQRHWMYWRTLADAYHLLDRYSEEFKTAETGREHHPDDTVLLSEMLRALLAMGDLMRLDSLLAEVGRMETLPERISPGGALLTAATWAEHDGHPEKATQIAERALEWQRLHQPEHSQNIVWCFLMANRPREGLELLDGLISEAPDDRWLHHLRGIALAMTGQEAEAEEEADWLKALDGPDLRGQTTQWRAGIAAILGQKETAVELLRQSLREGRVWWDLYPGWDFASLVGYEPFEELRKIKDRPPPEPSVLERLKGLLR